MQNKSTLMATMALGLLCGGAFRSEATLADYQAAVLAEPSLATYYKFDDGYGYDWKGGLYLAPSFWQPPWDAYPAVYTNGLAGGPDKALIQDGTGHGVPYQYNLTAADFASGQGTVELWVKPGWTGAGDVGPGSPDLVTLLCDAYTDIRYTVAMDVAKTTVVVHDGWARGLGAANTKSFTLPQAADTNWHHLAVEFASGNCTVIWDGQSLGTQTYDLGLVTGPDCFTLGAFYFHMPTAVYKDWIGEQDEVAIYSTNLPLASIQAHYAASLPPPSSILPVILTQPSPTNNWYVGQRRGLSIEVDPLQLPHYQWYKGIGVLSNQTNRALSVSSIVLGDAGTYTCVVTNIGGSVTSSPAVVVVWPTPATNAMSAYKTSVFAETSLVSYYSFDASNAIDDFGGNNGALWYDTSFATGAGGGSDQALKLLTGGGMDRLGAVRAFDFVGGNGTVEMWIQAGWDTNGFGDYPVILADWNTSINTATYAFSMDPAKTYIVLWNNAGMWSDIPLPANAGTNWHHLVMVFNAGSSWTLFWDGVNAGTNSLAVRNSYHGGETILGSPLPNGGFSVIQPWTGALDEVAFYSTALSASAVRNHLGIVSPVIAVAKSGNDLLLSWTGAGSWILESSPALSPASWTSVQTNGSPVSVSMSGNQFFRLRSQ